MVDVSGDCELCTAPVCFGVGSFFGREWNNVTKKLLHTAASQLIDPLTGARPFLVRCVDAMHSFFDDFSFLLER